MYAGVVVRMNCSINSGHQLTQRLEAVRITQINFELVVETFLVAILPGTARFGARDIDAECGECSDEYLRAVLTAVVGVEDAWSGVVVCGREQGREYQRDSMVRVDRESHHLSGV